MTKPNDIEQPDPTLDAVDEAEWPTTEGEAEKPEGESTEDERGMRRVVVTIWDDGQWQIVRTNAFPTDLFMFSQILDYYARMQLTQGYLQQQQEQDLRRKLTERITIPGMGPS